MNLLSLSLDDVREALDSHEPETLADPGRQRAAVAMVLRENGSGLSMLFIHRAHDSRDPWSGHLAFPGGRVDKGDKGPRNAAERETAEELGIDLSMAGFLGRLSDIIGANLPVQVSCFVYGFNGTAPALAPNNEVDDAFWISFKELLAPERRVSSTVRFSGRVMEASAIRLSPPGKPVLWGITYRLVMQLLALLEGEAEKARQLSRLEV